jgi:hypothetical protein
MWGAAPMRVVSGGVDITLPVPPRWVRMEGAVVGRGAAGSLRAVVGQWRGFARSGVVPVGFASGHFEMLGFAGGGPAGGDVCHRVVTSRVRQGGTQGDRNLSTCLRHGLVELVSGRLGVVGPVDPCFGA